MLVRNAIALMSRYGTVERDGIDLTVIVNGVSIRTAGGIGERDSIGYTYIRERDGRYCYSSLQWTLCRALSRGIDYAHDGKVYILESSYVVRGRSIVGPTYYLMVDGESVDIGMLPPDMLEDCLTDGTLCYVVDYLTDAVSV